MAGKREITDKKAEIKYSGKYLRMMDLNTWEFVERTNCSGAVAIISLNEQQEVILIEQYRPAMNKNIIEFPAGLVSDSGSEEEAEVAAVRELEEETGYSAEKISHLATGPTAPGLSSEIITLVLAEDLKKVSAGGGVESESIIVHEVPLAEIDEWLKQKETEGLIIDLKVYAGLYFLGKNR